MPEWAQYLSFGLSTVATLLGLVATVLALRRDSVSLLVRPFWAYRVGDQVRQSRRKDALQKHPHGSFGIEVINTGSVAVTIGEIGLSNDRFTWIREQLPNFIEARDRVLLFDDVLEGGGLPCRLEPRTTMRIRAALAADREPIVLKRRHVYATTQCQRVRYGRQRLRR